MVTAQTNIIGKVILAGAGPGDPELLTLKTARYLAQADVILTDRLVSPEILLTHASAKAEIIYVGKQCGSGVSTKQSDINAMLVHYASNGKFVVRLKGGDVSFFSNVLDELETLTANNIPYEIVPGITAASGAAAYAGIPLTARDHATAVRFLNGCKPASFPSEHWQQLATTDDTLVFYMSGDAIPEIVSNLQRHGIDPSKKLAMISQATTPMQKVFISNIDDVDEAIRQHFVSPSIIIIGKVVNLHESFGWMKKSNQSGNYFDPIVKISQVITEQKDKEKEYAGRA